MIGLARRIGAGRLGRLAAVPLLPALSVLAAAGLAVAAVVISLVASSALNGAALESATRTGEFVRFGVERDVREALETGRVSERLRRSFERSEERTSGPDGLLAVRVRDRAGRVVFADDPSLVGRTLPLPAEARSALEGEPGSERNPSLLVDIEDPGDVVRTYIPVTPARAGEPSPGVYELLRDYSPIAASVRDRLATINIVLVALAIVLYALLFPLLRRDSRLIAAAYHPRRLREASELRRGIRGGQLELEYQPKVEMRSASVVGVEALVRWNHPRRGRLMPGDFLPLAERADLIDELTDAVLEVALSQVAAWRVAGVDLRVAVNISVLNLKREDFPERIGRALGRHGLPPGALAVEVTETVLIDDEGAVACLRRIGDMGVHISLDDFGTGYSSLRRLRGLPIDEIKIDRSFVARIADDGDDLKLVTAVIGLARDLERSVVAEGVEGLDVLRRLDDLGCDSAQGYCIARPLPAGDVLDWLSTLSASPCMQMLRSRPKLDPLEPAPVRSLDLPGNTRRRAPPTGRRPA